jgi:hypothetical protein
MGCEIACNRGITKFVWRIDTLWVITSQGKSLLSLARVVGWASEYQRTFDDLARQGYRLTWVNGYESSGIEKFASIWEKRPARHGWHVEGLLATSYNCSRLHFGSKAIV